jgi:hypothetical protein
VKRGVEDTLAVVGVINYGGDRRPRAVGDCFPPARLTGVLGQVVVQHGGPTRQELNQVHTTVGGECVAPPGMLLSGALYTLGERECLADRNGDTGPRQQVTDRLLVIVVRRQPKL